MSNPKGYGIEREPEEAEEHDEEVEEETPEDQKQGRTLIEIATGKEIRVEKAVTSRGEADNVKREFWVCPRHGCHWLNKAESKRCEVCGAVNPAIEPFVTRYW